MNKINISENMIENGIYFFLNGRLLETNSELYIEELKTPNITKITVLDDNNEIGA